MPAKFELYTDSAGKFRFRLKARNGEIIASSEAYESKAERQERHQAGAAERGVGDGRRPDLIGVTR